jgi:hypothetical protein
MVFTASYTGESADGRTTLELNLDFFDDDLAPHADFRVDSNGLTRCPSSQIAGSTDSRATGFVLDARAASDPSGAPLARFIWRNHEGGLIGESDKPCYRILGCPQGPIQLEVVNRADPPRSSTRTRGNLLLQGEPYEDEYLGTSLAAGDFDGDGYQDLVVGVPHDDGRGDPQSMQWCGADPDTAASEGAYPPIAAGSVQVLYGSVAGLVANRNELWHQDKGRVNGQRVHGDELGAAVAVGDFDGDGKADVAIGVPGKDSAGKLGSVANSGMVTVLYGGGGGLSDRGGSANTFFHQDLSGMLGVREAHDRFGAALAAGDFDGDGYADLAVGVPGEDDYAGAVQGPPNGGSARAPCGME